MRNPKRLNGRELFSVWLIRTLKFNCHSLFYVILVLSWIQFGDFQRAPCFHCESYRHTHPHSNPYNQIRGHCTYPCACLEASVACPDGVPIVTDGCGCCLICAGQIGEECDRVKLCDIQRHLACIYTDTHASHGVCQVSRPKCVPYRTEWTPCSRTCGSGISVRQTNDNPECEIRNESRICLIRPCGQTTNSSQTFRIRRHRSQCRATLRNVNSTVLTDGESCVSLRIYRPSYCGACPEEKCCHPSVVSTRRVKFKCTNTPNKESIDKLYMWIKKCQCSSKC